MSLSAQIDSNAHSVSQEPERRGKWPKTGGRAQGWLAWLTLKGGGATAPTVLQSETSPDSSECISAGDES